MVLGFLAFPSNHPQWRFLAPLLLFFFSIVYFRLHLHFPLVLSKIKLKNLYNFINFLIPNKLTTFIFTKTCLLHYELQLVQTLPCVQLLLFLLCLFYIFFVFFILIIDRFTPLTAPHRFGCGFSFQSSLCFCFYFFYLIYAIEYLNRFFLFYKLIFLFILMLFYFCL